MFQCDFCGKASKPKEKVTFVVVEKRDKHYHFRSKANRGYKRRGKEIIRPLRKSTKRDDRIDDAGGTGWEIVRESKACTACASKE